MVTIRTAVMLLQGSRTAEMLAVKWALSPVEAAWNCNTTTTFTILHNNHLLLTS